MPGEERLIPVYTLQPPPREEQERAEGIRPRWFLHHHGNGLQQSDIKFEVLHSCGNWTWAHYKFCGGCGQPLQIEDRHDRVIQANVHQAHRRQQAKAEPPPPAAPEPGSFNAPRWGNRQAAPPGPKLP